jgi:hypothetical protein
MKKILFGILAFGLMAGMANATDVTKNLKFVWNMDQPPADLAGYNIYMGDTIIATYSGTDMSFSKSVSMNDQDNCFSITAFDSAYLTDIENKSSHESPKSEPFCLNLPPAAPTTFRVIIDATVTIDRMIPAPETLQKSIPAKKVIK